MIGRSDEAAHHHAAPQEGQVAPGLFVGEVGDVGWLTKLTKRLATPISAIR
jgi:hypothetical protein